MVSRIGKLPIFHSTPGLRIWNRLLKRRAWIVFRYSAFRRAARSRLLTPFVIPKEFRRSDVWSLGCVIYEMVTGRGAFARNTGADTLAGILADEPPPLAAGSLATPPELQSIVTRTLQKKRANRYQTVKELLADLRGLKQEREFRARLGSTTT